MSDRGPVRHRWRTRLRAWWYGYKLRDLNVSCPWGPRCAKAEGERCPDIYCPLRFDEPTEPTEVVEKVSDTR